MPNEYSFEELAPGLYLVWKKIYIASSAFYIRVGHVKRVDHFGRPEWVALDNFCVQISAKHATRLDAAVAIG